MASTNPLEIPEIAHMVASAVQAGLSYRRTLQLYLPFGPGQLSVYTHRHLIQDLSLFTTFSGLDEYDYPDVRRIVVDMINTKGPVPNITMDFTKLTPFLVDLKLVNVSTKQAFWETLSENPHLRSLTLCAMFLTYSIPSLWKTCMKLESLRMDRQGYRWPKEHSDLSLVNKLDGLNKYDYPKVRRLKVDMSHPQSLTKRIAMDFTSLTPLLVDSELMSVGTNQGFWERLSEHPHLRTLALLKMRFETHATPGLWKTCMKLESLEMEHVEIKDEGRLRNVVFDRMRNLMTGTKLKNEPYQLDLILQSPMLDSLDWEIQTSRQSGTITE
ncbi:MAG: hypothetical protein J3Q66DRAFT_408073 [Benniella sp.]|nr:MAG: hypothetical protein J3Q66DRAFT_408113 [Benniella sp.]KAK3804674.1 MAG: hypothetical protein J3Q66DRAFT_408073 [Benniella sp.]